MAAVHRRKPAEREVIRAAQIEASKLKQAALAGAPPVDSIPGYTITREIGRGGMAVIYEAQQKEPPRPVALKVMSGGATVSKQRLRLFRQETETLARLSCPNIAAIYGAGSTIDGRHFFAMELVRGFPVTEYARLQNLSLRETLQLFKQICQAVHYAHQRGVIHRDLKPSNIIVDMEGNPKVLDFGLARMADSDETMRAMWAESGKIMGTLPYMSPEQAEGNQDALDIRTDIYSLGVILYELLTDRLPYELTEVDREKARGIIRNSAPRRPSRYRRGLRGDLDLIILKALDKDPAKRYQSALALAEDVGRFLKRQTISARTLNIAYLLRKFISRQRLPVALVAVLMLMLGGFAAWMKIEDDQRALDEQQRQQEVSRWRRNFQAENRDRLRAAQFWEAVATAGAGPELLDLAAERVGHDFADNPALAAAVRDTLAGAYARLGQSEEAARQWQTAASTLRKAAEQRVQRGDFAGAEPLLMQEYEIRRRFDEPGACETAALLADVYSSWGKPVQSSKWRERATTAKPEGGGH